MEMKTKSDRGGKNEVFGGLFWVGFFLATTNKRKR